jgi:hypothetical protein
METTLLLAGSIKHPAMQEMRLSMQAIIDTAHKHGGAAIDVSAAYGRPAVYVAIPKEYAKEPRGVNARTMDERMKRVAVAKRRAHKRAADATDTTLTGVGVYRGRGRGYYGTGTKPWGVTADVVRSVAFYMHRADRVILRSRLA